MNSKALYSVEMANPNGIITLQKGFGRADILEEAIHHQQGKLYSDTYFQENVNLLEVQAQDKLLEIGKKENGSKTEMGKNVEIKKLMNKCKVIDLFKVSWGTVVVLDFFKPTTFKLGHRLKSSKDCLWIITGIARSKFVENEKYQGLIESVNVWDCTIDPINHSNLPVIGEELNLVKE